MLRVLVPLVLVAFAAAPVSAAVLPATIPGAPNCPVFPQTNVWNKPVETLPVRSDSERLMGSIGMDAYLHPDFSSIAGGNYGIPYNVVGSGVTKKRVRFTWPDESDRGPYPIPRRPKIDGGSDRHILIVDRDAC